jgi:hypothetical protein
MQIRRAGSQPSGKGPADWFTSTVRIDPLFGAEAPARAAGNGWVQREGGPVEEIRPGDVVWFEPGEKHWHGASPNTAMTHIAIQEALDGKAVDWMEHVTDEQYQSKPRR